MRFVLLFLLLGLSSCDSVTEEETITGEYIFRKSDEQRYDLATLKPQNRPSYPWQEGSASSHKISKEYFRCKGSAMNPPHIVREGEKETARYNDCGGSDKHSLPLHNGNEFVYPILIDLLNRIQEVTGKPVIITSGHRCPDHNLYIDPSPANSGSKHQIGAEVDFYIKGLEGRPESAVKIIEDFYKSQARYQKQPEYQTFHRFERATNVSTQPWFNKEVFIKLFRANEGRNFDNRHPYPYISIQVRFDRASNLPVTCNWADAQKFLRR